MYHPDDCRALGQTVYPVAAGRFHGVGDKHAWRLVPQRLVISLTERGTVDEQLAWGGCSVAKGDLIALWPDRWHDVTERDGRPARTVWLELDGPGVPAIAAAFGVSERAPVVRPRAPATAVRLMRAIVAGQSSAARLPPAEFYARLFALAELCTRSSWRASERRMATLIERAEALWRGEPFATLGPAALAARLGVHANTLLAAARAERGTTAARLVLGWKIERARSLLAHGAPKLAAVAHACGFASVSQFSRAFRAATGRNPGRHRTAAFPISPLASPAPPASG